MASSRAWSVGLACAVLLVVVPTALASQTPAAPLADPQPPDAGVEAAIPRSLRWGPQRAGLVRYNRVEGLSVGARLAIRPELAGEALPVILTGRGALAGPSGSVRLDVARSTLRRMVGASVYSEVAAMPGGPDPLGSAASLLSLAGRDDGDYYRRSGGAVRMASPAGAPLQVTAVAYAEHHGALAVHTRVALPRLWDSGWTYRPNTAAAVGWEYGVEGSLTHRWGTDPRRLGTSLSAGARLATGRSDFVQGSVAAALRVPLASSWTVRLESEAGGSGGAPPPQRQWAMGGPLTVRGTDPRRRVGPCFWRGRTELVLRLGPGELVGFADAGWAGGCTGSGEPGAVGSGPLVSVGGAVHLLDGILRLSWGRALDDAASRFDLGLGGVP